MKITSKDLVDSGISQVVKNDKGVAPNRSEGGKESDSGSPAKISISAEARYLQKAAELASRGDEIRAEKVRNIKDQLQQGTYRVEAGDVAKSVARSEIARLLGKQ